MHVMFLIDSMEGGGAERACLNIANHLCGKHHVSLVAMFDAENPGYRMDPRIDYYQLHIRKNHALYRKPDIYFREISMLRKLKKRLHTDCCISFLETANFLNVLSCTGEKTIISICNYYSKSLWRERILFQKIKASYASKNADRTVCVSRTILYDMMDNFGTPAERAEIIYNMYEPAQAINPVQEQYERFLEQKKSASTVFITAGRYVEQKAHRNLIRAFRKVHAAVPSAKLYLFGKGPLKKELQDTINRYGLQDNVFLMDFDPGVVSYLKEADVYVCSSLWEGFSNSLLEALANGLPAVSTDCRSGPRELLAPGTDCRQEAQGIEYAEYGVLVPVCRAGIPSEEDLSAEEECLAGAMIRLANDGSMRTAYREKAAERMKSFTPDVIMSQWERLIEKTTGTM